MAAAELGGLSREELLELVRRQPEELAAREAAIERRDAKIRALEEERSQVRRPAKTPESSSVPASLGPKASRVGGRRKLGPKRGHVGVSRVRSEPAMVIACRPSRCAGCGDVLPQGGGRRVGRSQVTDLPAFAPVVIEARQDAVRCAHCGEQTVGSYPGGLEPRRSCGPGSEARLRYVHERHHVGYERLVELGRDVVGLRISQGGVENALRRLVERARPTDAAIGETVRGSPVINSDETRARVAGRTQWQGGVQTSEASSHVIVPSRGGGVIENATDRLVFDRYVTPKTEAARRQHRYRTHRDCLSVFLSRDDVAPTTNSSERDLRPSLIHRTVIGGFRSAWGAAASAIRSSILATARKQGRHLLDAFRPVAGPSPLQATPTPT